METNKNRGGKVARSLISLESAGGETRSEPQAKANKPARGLAHPHLPLPHLLLQNYFLTKKKKKVFSSLGAHLFLLHPLVLHGTGSSSVSLPPPFPWLLVFVCFPKNFHIPLFKNTCVVVEKKWTKIAAWPSGHFSCVHLPLPQKNPFLLLCNS